MNVLNTKTDSFPFSSSTLTNSDFYTGAFPSEYGNALSGVFDLKMRNGNNEKQEYTFMVGALGEELQQGAYTWSARVTFVSGNTILQTGTVTILK